MYHTGGGRTGDVCHAVAFNLACQYRHFIQNNFKQHLTICPPCVQRVSDVGDNLFRF